MGQISGGWAYVYGAWGISLGLLVGYALWTEWRLSRPIPEADRLEDPTAPIVRD